LTPNSGEVYRSPYIVYCHRTIYVKLVLYVG